MTNEDPQDLNISLQFTPCYVIVQQRPVQLATTSAFFKCIMTLQPVISEIAKVATSLLIKADLGCHPHAGATGVTGSLFF